MKLKTASLLAISGTSVALAYNLINFLRNLVVAGRVPPFGLLAVVTSVIFQVCLLIFFVTLYRKQ
jgi:predicted Co/Zn/Cd cation transporter (cation efflux family)